jgi:LCP family protein required for cell wall assembly
VAGNREGASESWTGPGGSQQGPQGSRPKDAGRQPAGSRQPGEGSAASGPHDPGARGSGPPSPGARRTSQPSGGRVALASRPPPGSGGPPSRPGLRRPSRAYIVSCVLAALILVVSGFAYQTVRGVLSIGSSDAIASGPSTGAQNILLMGIESRRYWNGAILPPSILAKLHAGSAQAVANGVGGNDTNTLILIHVFADGKRAVGFSIPRDDWVRFGDTIGPQQQGKVDQAYGVSMFYREEQLTQQNPNINANTLGTLGNEAGQAAAVATVERLTGVHIDHFAAVNLYGFYELAQVLGGVEVCLNHPVNDPNSGADFPAGYQHLDAAQALAFVRQRDGLPNGDLDRTHRQQAFLDSVMHQLRTEGVLSDLTKIQALINVARQYVITDRGWNLLDFAAEARNLTNANLVFHTLPIAGYATIDGQDANQVNPAYIRTIVHETFYPRPARRTSGTSKSSASADAHNTTVDVFNGGQTAGLAHDVSAALVHAGYRAGQIGNTSYRTSTAVLYGAAAQSEAATIARLFGVAAIAGGSVAAGHVQILLGADATVPTIPSVSLSSPSPVIPTSGPQGGAVAAKNGIPCVN